LTPLLLLHRWLSAAWLPEARPAWIGRLPATRRVWSLVRLSAPAGAAR
jgi:hypothetical protein